MSQDLRVETEAKLVEVIQKPYKVEGNEGISYKLLFLVNDKNWELKSSLEQTEDLKPLQGSVGKATFLVQSRKESVTLKLASFVKSK